MSKSLKNFTSVREVLEEGGVAHCAVTKGGLEGPRALSDAFRLWCLGHHYTDTLTYSPERLRDAAVVGRKLEAALVVAQDFLFSDTGACASDARWGEKEAALASEWGEAAARVDEALRKDCDTPTALRALSAVGAKLKAYTAAAHEHSAAARLLVGWVAMGFAKRLAVFGLGFAEERLFALEQLHCPGPMNVALSPPAMPSSSPPEALLALVTHRQQLRMEAARASKALAKGDSAAAEQAVKGILQLCDALRKDDIPKLGWSLQDTPEGPKLLKR